MRLKRWGLLLPLLVGLNLLLYFWCRPGAALLRAGRCNVLVVTIDLLRADRVSSTLTPNLLSVAGRGVLFTDAFAHAPLTWTASRALLCGQLSSGCTPETPSLASILHAHGYATSAFVSTSLLLLPDLQRGFDEFDGPAATDRNNVRGGSDTNERFEQWLSKMGSRPWFAWLMYWDVHSPDKVPRRVLGDVPARDVEGMYDALVRYEDECLGEVLHHLESRGELERTIVVVTSNHGIPRPRTLPWHGSTALHDAELHVPLVMQVPGRPAGEVRSDLVAHEDIMPTVLSRLEIPTRKADGIDLFAARRGSGAFVGAETDGATGRAVITSEWEYVEYERESLSSGPGEAVRRYQAGDRELFRRRADPECLHNLASAYPDVAARLHAAVQHDDQPVRDFAMPGPEVREAMRRHGYDF